jgi:hypothetical protein
MTVARLTLLSSLVVSSLVACTATRRVLPATSPAEGPGRTHLAWQATFKGRMEIGVERQRFEGSLALEEPDRLFVEIAGPVGGVRAAMAVSPGHLRVLLPATRQFIDEEPGPASYEFLLGLPLDTAGLIEMIRLGLDPACAEDPCARTLPLPADPRGNARSLQVLRRQAQLTASLAGDDLAGMEQAGPTRLELRFTQSASSLPGTIDPDLFDPKIPDGFTRLRPGASSGPATLLLPR